MMKLDRCLKELFFISWLFCGFNIHSQTNNSYTTVKTASGCAAFTSRKLDDMAIQFSGECKDGLISGTGTLKLFSQGRLVYSAQGQFSRGYGNGHGTVIESDGAKTIGNYVNGLLNGKAMSITSEGDRLFGNYINGSRNGQFTVNYSNGEKYVGEYKDNVKHGQGAYTYADGAIYLGQFKNGVPDGQGRLTEKDGALIYEGVWVKGEFKNSKSSK